MKSVLEWQLRRCVSSAFRFGCFGSGTDRKLREPRCFAISDVAIASVKMRSRRSVWTWFTWHIWTRELQLELQWEQRQTWQIQRIQRTVRTARPRKLCEQRLHYNVEKTCKKQRTASPTAFPTDSTDANWAKSVKSSRSNLPNMCNRLNTWDTCNMCNSRWRCHMSHYESHSKFIPKAPVPQLLMDFMKNKETALL